MALYINDDREIVDDDQDDWYLKLSSSDGCLTIESLPPETGSLVVVNPHIILDTYEVDLIHRLFIDIDTPSTESDEISIIRELRVNAPISKVALAQRFTISAKKGTVRGFIFNLLLEYQLEGGVTKAIHISLYVDVIKTIKAIEEVLTSR